MSTPTSIDTADSPPDAIDPLKIIHLDASDLSQADVMRCSLPGHKPNLAFTSFDDYEVHYNKAHVNRCVECRKNFPTPHFLSLHQAENHDPLAAIRKERGEKTFACFVEGCDKVCSGPQKRKLHLIDKHMFPKDYDFYIVNDGIDRKTSLLRAGRQRRRTSLVHQKVAKKDRGEQKQTTADDKPAPNDSSKMDIELPEQPSDTAETVAGRDSLPATAQESSTAMDVDGLTGAMSSLRFVPPSIRFGGRGRGRAGLSKS